ncbi:hypothetical protein CC80DRAFT_589074 [Byssothecium circinans]|uniref:Wax synthase domain-containing protein n=1 Tax=Byssothecium circinans TaxID=147558 RepID=A0A6A5UE32_9PLEO|nr:hypothetical protein CC80DRAFT_589074 [Byssothecium circinans]
MHPIIYLVTQIILTVLVIGFSTPYAVLRPTGFVFMTFCVYRCIPGCMPYMTRTPWAALVGGYSITYLYHYLDVALLSRWSFKHGAPVSGLLRPNPSPANAPRNYRPQDTESIRERLIFGMKVTSTFRFVGTRYEVRNTPAAIATERRAFARRTFTTILISYCVLDFINSNNDPIIAAKFLTLEKIPILTRLQEVTAEELTIRTFTVLAAGIGLNCVQGGVYHICALLAVRAGISEPSEWPPFYGEAGEAYTLRRFWDVFWHQTNSRKFSSIAHYSTHVLFGLPRGTKFAQNTRILIAFMSSGIMHLVDDIASGVSFHDSGALRFFLVQALGMIVEDSVLRAYHLLIPSSRLRLSNTAARIAGFLWVAAFLVWSVPAYMYPMLWRANQGLDDSTIPFSLFGSHAERCKAIACLALGGIIAWTV